MGIEVSKSCRSSQIRQLNEGWQSNESSIHRNSPVGYPSPHNLGARPRNEMGIIRRNSPSWREIEMTNICINGSIRGETEMTNILRNMPLLLKYDASYRPRNPPTCYPIPNWVDDLRGNEMRNSLRNNSTLPGNEMSYNRRSGLIRPGDKTIYSRRNSSNSPAGNPIPHSWPPIESVTKHKNVTRIQSVVNLSMSTLRLEEDEENPGYHLLAFTFDEIMPGSIGICYLARKGLNSSILPLRSYLFPPLQIAFNRGFGQNFRQATGTGVNLSLLEDLGVVDNGNPSDGDFRLIIRLETEQQNGWPRAPLPRDVPCHITQADIKKTGGQYRVSVLKQFVWVEGVCYEVNQIYAIGISSDEGESKELNCSICWTRPRVILALPCRHICMCERCAKRLWLQSNCCPVCKTPMERLLEIEEVGVV